ncbi:unnamed protein product [Brassica napus]|uniref:(rape) hypothetical protein n=2 Tax=Brassica napus TaxID=3708 RepID=A0A816Y0X7_BRANA|nr:unnamed protein product [Brassica napus]
MEVRPVGKTDNERLRVRRLRGGLVYHIHGHSRDMIRIRILGVDLISILRRMNWIEKFMAYNEILKTFEDQEELKEGYGNGEEACREDKEQRALHCPECIFHQRHIYKAKKEEDEHDNLKPASIAGGESFTHDVLSLHGFQFYSFETLIHAYRTK